MTNQFPRFSPTRVVVLLLCMGCASTARAQGIGFTGGAAVDPGQAYVGTYFESAPIASRLRLRPGIDGGFGSGVSEAIIDFAFLYEIPFGPLSNWFVYQGTGPTVTILRINDQHHTSGGFLGVFGIGNKKGFFAEAKVSGGDGPSLRAGAGYTIRFHSTP
jgi:hypothetical protein